MGGSRAFDESGGKEEIRMNWKRTARWSWLILPFLLLAVWPSAAVAWNEDGLVADVVLYEVWEDVFGTGPDSVFGFDHVDRVSPISGSAKIDTLVCAVARVLHPSASTCTVNAVGTNHIQLGGADGKTPVSIKATGDYAVVDQLDNPFDSPERVITRGTFTGTVFPIAFPAGTSKRIINEFKHLDFQPLLGIAGELTVNLEPLGMGVITLQFTGTFRLPFGFNERGEMERRPRHGHATFYLSDTGKLIPVRSDEMSLGFPTPRMEITVGH